MQITLSELGQVEAYAAKSRAISSNVLTPTEVTALAEAWMHLAELEEKL